MSSTLELKVVFAAIDKFVRPVKAITGAASEAAKALKATNDKAAELNSTISKINAYEKLNKDAAITANVIKKTSAEIATLKEAMAKAEKPTEEQAASLAKLTRKLGDATAKTERFRTQEIDLRTALKQSGVETNQLATAREHLSSASAAATMDSKRLQSALDAENQKMRRLHEAQANMRKARERAGKLAMTGAGISAAGVAAAVPVGKTLSDFTSFETAMLGVARQMDGARDDNGKVTKTYWEMAAAIKAMSERLPGSANDIAKIVEGGARMGIQGKENLLVYAETTAVMANAFDLPVDQIGQDIGTISQLYKVPIKDIKQLGDTINWLDDQTLAKGADIIDVMKRIAGTADMVKMSYKEAAALGSTFLSSGATAEVAASASNAMMRELSIATMQSKRFQTGMEMLGLKSDDVQKGMSNNATGTIMMVLEKIKALKPEKQLEATTRLFGKEFGDDAAKLASNLDKYREALRLVNEEKAKGSMDRELSAWQDTLAASTENTQNTFNNLSSDLGAFLKGEAVGALEWTMKMVQSVREWAAENPHVSDTLMTVAKLLAISLTVIGGLIAAVGAIVVPLAIMNLALVQIGLTSGVASTAMGVLGGFISTVGRAILLSPLSPWLVGIGLAASVIYANWDGIKAWFSDVIDTILGKLAKFKEFIQKMAPGLFGDSSSPTSKVSVTESIGTAPALKAAGNTSNNITIHATTGATATELAAAMKRELAAIEREKAARQRGALRDTN
ncbi:MAG: phage tail tape measure protein [Ferribacterium limneticum]